MKTNTKNPYILLAVVISILGIIIRLKGLGKWPVAVDEYYFISSIENIIRTNLPRFECGGYYIRGIFQQYLTVPLRLYLNDPELAIRIIPLIANIAAFPAIFLICRKIGGWSAAVIGIFFLAFSLWEIEFSRFGRMYALFQTIVIWQVWLVLQANKPSELVNTWLCYGLAFLSVFVYAGAIFCFGLAVLNPILNKKSIKIYDYIAWLGIAVLITVTHIIPFRRLGVGQFLPPEYIVSTAANGTTFPVLFPERILALSEDFILFPILALVLGVWGIGLIAYSIYRVKGAEPVATIGLIIAIIAVISNQLALFLGSLVAVYLLSKNTMFAWFKENSRAFIIYCLAIIFWFVGLGFYIFIQSSNSGLVQAIKEVINSMFSYPDVYFRIFKPWYSAMPYQTILASIAAVLAFLLVFNAKRDNDVKFNRLLGIILILVMITAMMSTFYVDSRYTYYLYPLILSVCAIVIVRMVPAGFSMWSKNASLIILVSLFFLISDDFSAKDAIEIDSERVNFRLDYDGPRTRHYYPRIDFQSAAEYINSRRQANSILVTAVPVIDYYIKDHQGAYFYLPLTHDSFTSRSACGGKRDIWSGYDLLYTEDSFKTKIADSNFERWVVIYGPGKKITLPPIYKKIDDMLVEYHQFNSIEDAIHIYKIPKGVQVNL